MAFQCVIVTPEQQVMDEKVDQVILPAHDGMVGILTDRAPLLVKLGTGPLRIDQPGSKQQILFVDGGIAQMKDNNLTIVTDEAIPLDEIDAAAARAEFDEALKLPATDEHARQQRERRLQRARMKQHLTAK